MSRSEEELLSNDIERYSEVMPHIHEQDAALLERQKKVLQNRPSWDDIGEAYLNKADLALLKKFDSGREDKVVLMTRDGQTYARIFMTLLSKVQDKEMLGYIVTLVDSLIKEDIEISQHFWNLKDTEISGVSNLPFGPLIKLVTRHKAKGWYLKTQICNVISILFSQYEGQVPEPDQKTFFHWLGDQCKHDNKKLVYNALSTLQTLLRYESYRSRFYDERGLEALSGIATIRQNHSQLLYLTIYCLWDLSYHPEVKKNMTEPILISNLVEILKNTKTIEKVIRVVLATLRNILDIGDNNELMISYGIMRCLGLFQNKKWGDEEIEGNLEILQNALEKKVNDLSSFDIYKNELLSKKLDWNTPSHKSERFWKANILRFDEDNYKVAHILADILKDKNQKPSVLAVACWDAGELVKHHPNKRFLLMSVDIKESVMRLLDFPDNEVKKEALRALQKVMVTNWQNLM